MGFKPTCEESIRTYNLCFLGFGNVNRTLIRLLEDRAQELRECHGIALPHHRNRLAPPGLDRRPRRSRSETKCGAGTPAREMPAADSSLRASQEVPSNARTWLAAASADVLFEATSLNVTDGQPAVDDIRAALEHGAHAITANKGPIVYAYRELRDLARARGGKNPSSNRRSWTAFRFFFVRADTRHSPARLPSNLQLHHQRDSERWTGLNFDEALKKAQAIGIAETDATHDIDGWDAAVKTAALITVLMDAPIHLEEIKREGIRDLTPQALRNARRDGWPFKLVCRAKREGEKVAATVAPEKVLSTSPMAKIAGTSSYLYFETDIFPGLAITEENPGLYATAYGMLADFVRAVCD